MASGEAVPVGTARQRGTLKRSCSSDSHSLSGRGMPTSVTYLASSDG